MPSPFPGMDPYLEAPGIWPDFHATMIGAIREAIIAGLPPNYDARIDERVRLVAPDEPPQLRYPDVGVSRHAEPARPSPAAGVPTATLEPVALTEADEERTYYVRILHGRERDLVTVVELLSPTNKTGVGLDEAEARRREFLKARVNVVEINLLVGGERPGIASPWPAGEYYALVARPGRPPEAGVAAWPLRSPLPAIAIPLRPPDTDVPIRLAAAFAVAYDRGRYGRAVDYAAPVPAPLSADDRAWAEGLARSAAAG